MQTHNSGHFINLVFLQMVTISTDRMHKTLWNGKRQEDVLLLREFYGDSVLERKEKGQGQMKKIRKLWQQVKIVKKVNLNVWLKNNEEISLSSYSLSDSIYSTSHQVN